MNREEREARVIQKALASTLQHLREEKKVAQETLAVESGIGRSHMSSMERGFGNPTLLTIFRLLPLLGVTFTQFAQEMDRHLRPKTR